MEDISVITAVHHPLRRRIYDYLLLYGTSQVTTLARALESQVGSISHHLRMLERAGVVERVPDPDGDKRTSWWAVARRGLTWSTDDYADSPSDALLAREAQRQGIRMQIERLQQWHRHRHDPAYVGYDGSNTETTTWASPDELRDLSARLLATIREWQDGIDLADDQSRTPIFVFAHAFPTVP
ncbi:helix-turn-helix domain-containing protein [Microbacterium aurugineum]|uniref:winged helix-turn-helix domain-containing protein n=1 Tax=Microbacterium TaxID=33882 RepID=UPI0006481979|nr:MULTISPECIES: helix-turn-helix domain-containing protein [Microbacterium]PKQ35947.1 MAG: ArsR family transcriptional regulator [Actinobacteria bacterium HGW-Actinobacteria-11]MCE0508011.1 helix-turn-helix domain-containing protein [Microbacterium sp. KKR3/1]MCK8466183.1 helix-turn-helix domain-containing protein [Microbacterium aurugineum]QEA29348.1 helix-turn-helix transcriptional regulator [Microbacterium sp. CBA3102]TCJ29581.1 ArsR family transcriptional regulator [Microbacterium sp. PI-